MVRACVAAAYGDAAVDASGLGSGYGCASRIGRTPPYLSKIQPPPSGENQVTSAAADGPLNSWT